MMTDKEILMEMFKQLEQMLDQRQVVVRGQCQRCSKSLACPVVENLPLGGTMVYCNQFNPTKGEIDEDNR